MKKSFKVKTGYSTYVSIEKSELPKAYYSFITDGKMITKAGRLIRGKDIMDIEQDWHVVMGWHSDRELNFNEIGEERLEFSEKIMKNARDIANEAVQKNDMNLLSDKNIKRLNE
jgi:hypothetical protein